MLIDVHLCHAPADLQIAELLAKRLDRCAQAKSWLVPCGRNTPETLAATWDGGSSCAAILLLLSQESLPERLPREEWEPLLTHVEQHARPPVASVLLGDCMYPRLLERSAFFRWSRGPEKTLRDIGRWIIARHAGAPAFVAASLPWFEGRERELHLLWTSLVDSSGFIVVANPDPGSGKTALAQQFAAAAAAHFRDTLWIGCRGRSRNSIRGEIASLLGCSFENVDHFIHEQRILIVLDDVDGPPGIEWSPEARGSVLATARDRVRWGQHARTLEIETHTGAGRAADRPLGDVERRLFAAMAVCRPHASHLELAARISAVDLPQARAIADAAEGRIARLDAAGARFRVCALTEIEDSARAAHASAVYGMFSERGDPALLADAEDAFQWALTADWTLAPRLAARVCHLLREKKRLQEAADLYRRLRQAALARGDMDVAGDCAWELSWIEQDDDDLRRPFSPVAQLAFNWT